MPIGVLAAPSWFQHVSSVLDAGEMGVAGVFLDDTTVGGIVADWH